MKAVKEIGKKTLSSFCLNLYKKEVSKVLGVSWIFQDKIVVLTNIKF
jgi:hypothetical protein